jgi:hypothetical protein
VKTHLKSGGYLNKIFNTKTVLLSIILLFSFSIYTHSQIFHKNIFLVPTYDKSKDSYNILLNKQTNYGTVIDEVRRIGRKPGESRVDSAGTDNRAIKVIEGKDRYLVRLTLKKEDYENPITINVFNLLGNKVMEVYKGIPYSYDTPYEILVNELPKGVFICNVVGKGFRLDSKFIVTR